VLEHAKAVIDDPRVTFEIDQFLEPSPVTSDNTDAFRVLQYTLHQQFPDALVAPGLMIGNTDTRHYWNLTESIYRFSPFRATDSDLARFHGVDERISVDNYVEVVNFYYSLIQNSDSMLKR